MYFTGRKKGNTVVHRLNEYQYMAMERIVKGTPYLYEMCPAFVLPW